MGEVTKKQIEQFNDMRTGLRTIAREYQTPKQLRRNAKKAYGLGYHEALELAYENIQEEAKRWSRGVRPIKERP